MFTKGVLSCLKYLEAVPWNEREEEKLKSLFARFSFDNRTSRDVLARLYSTEPVVSQQHIAFQLVRSVTSGTHASSRRELKSLVKGLLSKSSVYEEDLAFCLRKEDLYDICRSCLGLLVKLFEEASDNYTIVPEEKSSSTMVQMTMNMNSKNHNHKPLIERISIQVDNVNWLLEILVDKQMAGDFVDVWTDQRELLRMHERVSPMVRYEVSRISAWVFIGVGSGRLHCESEARCGVLRAWFGPMLLDFGWLQKCRKGLDIKLLEESLGQAILMLPIRHQHVLFMEWFHCFSSRMQDQGGTTTTTECPNLSKAFHIWWRRWSFLTQTPPPPS